MTGFELRRRRLKLGMSQDQLAAALAVSKNSVRRWELADQTQLPALRSARLERALKELEPHKRERAQTLREAMGNEWVVHFRAVDTHKPLTNDERLALPPGTIYEKSNKAGGWHPYKRSHDPIYSDMPQ